MPNKKLAEIIEVFRRDNTRLAAERDAAIAERDAAVAAIRPRELVRLKVAAGLAGVHLETARRWCESGLVKSAMRQGSYWFCDAEELRTLAAQRCPPSEQQRSVY
jgi:hypothetical protein